MSIPLDIFSAQRRLRGTPFANTPKGLHFVMKLFEVERVETP